MTDQEILEKAIQKAIDGGWTFSLPNWSVETSHEDGLVIGSLIEFEGDEWFNGDYPELHTNDIIFNHDFAKALWGEEERDYAKDTNYRPSTGVYQVTNRGWKHHLQQIVIAEDPIQYLGKNI